jgi:molecular chaperone GrpE
MDQGKTIGMKKRRNAADDKNDLWQAKFNELTADLQRARADFENYRKTAEADKLRYGQTVRAETIGKLLPIIDDIERATAHLPADLAEHDWAKGVVGLNKNLQAKLAELGVSKINAQPGVKFDPNLHEAAQFDEDSEGATEVVASELRPGYLLNGAPLRHSMVKVAKK